MVLFNFICFWLLWHVESFRRPIREESQSIGGDKEWSGIRSFLPDEEIESRIIGGVEAWPHSWPWDVSLWFSGVPACGGSVMSSLWVITAAHCFTRYNQVSYWSAQVGKHNIDVPNESGQQVVSILKIFINQNYSPVTKINDVALLKLATSLQFSYTIKPIEIWMNPLDPGMMCTVTGWGSTRENGPRAQVLQEVNVTIMSIDVCNQGYTGQILPSMLCAGELEGGADACQGDSGGPLSCFTGSKYELAGLVSWGVGCGRALKPGVYTKIQDQIDWITDIVAGDDRNARVYANHELSETSKSCGAPEIAPCRLGLDKAGLTQSEKGEVHVLNITEACPYSWPWQVSLQASGQHFCSGTLIHQSWVLVPRHCSFNAEKHTVLLGIYDLSFTADQTITVDKVFDLNYDSSFPASTDLSLLQLSEPARIGDSIFPVCLPSMEQELDDSWSCVTTGWGSTKATVSVDPNRLHQARLGLVSPAVCRESWSADLIRETHICTDPTGLVSCMGDSGSPLFCQKTGVYYLFGLITWGSKYCDVRRPAVFSKISSYNYWLTKTMGQV